MTPADIAKARALCLSVRRVANDGPSVSWEGDVRAFTNGAYDLLPAALDEIERLTRGLEEMHIDCDVTSQGRLCCKAMDVRDNLLAGREWNDDGTATKE
jgi:hypothetical protein